MGIDVINQRSYSVNILRKTKKQYHAKLYEKDVADKKKFWNTDNHFFLRSFN